MLFNIVVLFIGSFVFAASYDDFAYVVNKQPINIYTGDINGTFSNLTSFPSNCPDNQYTYGLNGTDLFCRADISGGNTTSEIFDVCNNETWIRKVNTSVNTVLTNDPSDYDSLGDLQSSVSNDFHNLGGTDIDTANTTEEIHTAINNNTYVRRDNSTLNTVLTNDPSDWDAIGDVPTATPSDGDTTHLSLADQIYDWVIGLGYITSFTDTNASTACASNEYLDGDGGCVDVLEEGELDSLSELNTQLTDAVLVDTGTMTDAKWCKYVSASTDIQCNVDPVTDTANSTADIQAVAVGGEVSGTVGNIVLDHDALDDQYYDSESDLTTLLDDNYVDVAGDTMTGDLDIANSYPHIGLNDTDDSDAKYEFRVSSNDLLLYWDSGSILYYPLMFKDGNWGFSLLDTDSPLHEMTIDGDVNASSFICRSGSACISGSNITADSLSGTQIAELTDADISNTLTASILSPSANVDIGDYNLTSSGFILGDNEIQCYGDSCDVCEYWNGTDKIEESPCTMN